jgi:hypothetical protein
VLGVQLTSGHSLEVRWRQKGWPGTVEMEMRVPCRSTVGNHRHRQAGRMRRVVEDLDVEDGGQSAEALRADSQRIDLLVKLQTQFLDAIARAAGDQFMHVDRRHQRFLGQQHGLLGRAANADAQDSRWTPAGTHRRYGLEHPIDDRVRGVERVELGLVFRAAALGGADDFEVVSGDDLIMDDCRRVVARVLARAGRVEQYRGAQLVVRDCCRRGARPRRTFPEPTEWRPI